MAHRTRVSDKMNHLRQLKYLDKGVVMMPTLEQERGKRKVKPRRRGPHRGMTL